MTVQVNMIPKSAAAAECASDCQPRSTRLPAAGLALPAISPAQVKSLNAFYRRRPALAFSVAGLAATIDASWPPPPPSTDVSSRCRLDIAVDGAAGAVTLSRSLVDAVIAALDPDQRLDRLDPSHRALLLELALSDALSMLEANLGCRLAITLVTAPSHEGESGAVRLAFKVAVEGHGVSAGELLLQPGHATMFAQFLDRCASPPPSPQTADGGLGVAIELPVTVCLRVAAAMFAVGEIATLSPGDVVMADQYCQRTRTAVAVIAEHLVAPVELTAAGAQITARLKHARGSVWGWSMENGGDKSQADDLRKTNLDDIPVKLLFELGRTELSLAEIRQLAPGALIPMLRPLEDSVDIFANGRRIGRGNLVQIGDSMGIRITRLFDNA